MLITRQSAGIDGRCATPTVSARSEFARSTMAQHHDNFALWCLRPFKWAGSVVWVTTPLPKPVQTPPDHRGPQPWTQSQDSRDCVALANAPQLDSLEQHVVHFRRPELVRFQPSGKPRQKSCPHLCALPGQRRAVRVRQCGTDDRPPRLPSRQRANREHTAVEMDPGSGAFFPPSLLRRQSRGVR